MNALITTFGIDWHTLLIEVVNFGIVAGALTYLLYKPVLKMLKDREALVAKGVDDAARGGREALRSRGRRAEARRGGGQRSCQHRG